MDDAKNGQFKHKNGGSLDFLRNTFPSWPPLATVMTGIFENYMPKNFIF